MPRLINSNNKEPVTKSFSGSKNQSRVRTSENSKIRRSTHGIGGVAADVFGRRALDQALQDRLNPYTYESTGPILKWISLSFIIFVVAVGFLIVNHRNSINFVDDLYKQGISDIPPAKNDISSAVFVSQFMGDDKREPCSQAVIDDDVRFESLCRAGGYQRVSTFAKNNGIDCFNINDLRTLLNPVNESGCSRLVNIFDRYEKTKNITSLSLTMVVVVFLIICFQFSIFLHRTSRNLKTLGSEGQMYSPDGAVVSFFVPVLNLFRPIRVLKELFRASDSSVKGSNKQTWKNEGRSPSIVFIWGFSWIATVLFNPLVIARILYTERNDLQNIYSLNKMLFYSDILLILVSITAILMITRLSHWQKLRRKMVGEIIIVPPKLMDPIEKAVQQAASKRGIQLDKNSDGSQDSNRKKYFGRKRT